MATQQKIKESLKIMFCMITFAALLCNVSAHDSAKTWRISIKEKDSGSVAYTVSDPAVSDVLTKSASLKVSFWGYLDLTFTPSNGYKIKAILKNNEDITSALDSSNHIQFGPVESSHSIKVIFEAITPEGDHNVAFPSSPPEDLAPVSDVTGHYSGNSQLRGLTFAHETTRNYDLDLAEDEAGKIIIMGTLTGVSSDKTGTTLNLSSKMKTVKNVPTMKVHTNFKGTLDGLPIKSNSTATIPITLSPNVDSTTRQDSVWLDKVPSTYFAKADLKYVAVQSGIRYHDKNLPVKKDASSTIENNFTNGKKWSIKVSVSEEYVTVGKKTKKIIYAAGTLSLPNNIVTFSKVKIRYTVPKGISVKFKHGIDLSGEIDKKSTINIKKMTMREESDHSWTITGGTITYKIMNQKGKGSLLDFTTD